MSVSKITNLLTYVSDYFYYKIVRECHSVNISGIIEINNSKNNATLVIVAVIHIC